MSNTSIRGFVALPLFEHDPNAAGEVAYVMAGGPAYWERLRAASDLFHQEQVDQILLRNETDRIGYNYVRETPDTRVQKAIEFLVLYGVPKEKIQTVPAVSNAWLGSLSEAQSVAENFPDLGSIVVVTSAPHTRRSALCFRRSVGSKVRLSTFSATSLRQSSEIHSPIWLEYLKLAIYFIAA